VPRREPQSAAGERQKETDEIKPAAPESKGTLKRDENVPQEFFAKRKTSDLKSAQAVAPTAPAYELTLIPQKPFEGMDKLSPKIEALVKQSGGEYQYESRADGLKQNSFQEPQTVWLLIPEDRYDRFKNDLSGLGKIESELKTENAPPTPRSSAESLSKLRIKLTIRSAEKP
jgi:hypothetical protein